VLRRSASVLFLIAAAAATLGEVAGCGGNAPTAATTTTKEAKPRPQPPSALFHRAAVIIAERCAPCHTMHPTEPGCTSPPKGIRFDTAAQIKALAWQIQAMAVASTTMPLGNATHMTQAERMTLGEWFNAQLG
jgi:uncharacterized membrane protein